ncbi:unnamed protein product [Acanthosepion pharaonis]|uniref:Uncharacterized protein n=1 Tax=Acanthosepion pharaonis TaxID=158019 RepID=A0A812BC47_ACAPH|nr:unnamed protein product [Sepia pharaonis]
MKPEVILEADLLSFHRTSSPMHDDDDKFSYISSVSLEYDGDNFIMKSSLSEDETVSRNSSNSRASKESDEINPLDSVIPDCDDICWREKNSYSTYKLNEVPIQRNNVISKVRQIEENYRLSTTTKMKEGLWTVRNQSTLAGCTLFYFILLISLPFYSSFPNFSFHFISFLFCAYFWFFFTMSSFFLSISLSLSFFFLFSLGFLDQASFLSYTFLYFCLSVSFISLKSNSPSLLIYSLLSLSLVLFLRSSDLNCISLSHPLTLSLKFSSSPVLLSISVCMLSLSYRLVSFPLSLSLSFPFAF